MKKQLLAMTLLAGATVVSAETPLWLRDARIAPDGSAIAFTYKGDIWSVPANGGTARRLTTTGDYECNPVWSPDSRSIAFASDRKGNFDIFVMPAAGGQATRLTSNSAAEYPEAFTPDGKNVLFSAAIQDPAASALFPSGRMTELYSVPVKGGASVQILGTPAQLLSFMPDGKRFLYQDVKGFEDEWRKHHTSSVTRDVWLYNPADGSHVNLTSRGGEDRNPVVAPDGQNFYFLSERNGGTMNVYVAPVADPSQAKSLTSFKTHPVRFLSRDDKGVLCFTYDGEIYTMTPGGKPAKVKIDVVDDGENEIFKTGTSRLSSASFSPDGKQAAFTSRGNLFVTSVEYPSVKQITSTAAAETSPTWSKDGKKLVYASDRDGGVWNLYEATMGYDGDPNFSNATIIEEKLFVKPDGHDRMYPEFSPDGKKIAFIYDRHRLAVMDVESGKTTILTETALQPQTNGSFTYRWSPDSKWIALEINDRRHEPYSDIAIVNVDKPEVINLTNSGYFDMNPRWALGGNAIVFESERYGMRNHASWGSMSDVMMVFLNRDAYDKFRLSEEDYALRKEIEKESKKKQKDEDKDKDKDKKKDKDNEDEEDSIKVETTGVADRIVRLTPASSQLYDFFVDDDDENLYYIAGTADGSKLWKLNLRKDEHHQVGSAGGTGFYVSPDAKHVFIVGSGGMKKFTPGSDKSKAITYTASQKIDPAAEREYMFDEVVRAEQERFYDKGMHGVDWKAMAKAYRKFLPHINNNYDYAEMLSELLGELNVSHTGARYRAGGGGERTASLGLLYDLSYDGDGLRVAEIVEKGPFDNANSRIAEGSVITAINGEKLDMHNVDMSVVFNDIAGKKTLVDFTLPDGEKVREVILPISSGSMSSLLYDRWVKNRAADVDRWSNGRLGYVHIESMDDDSFRKVYSDLLGKYNDREGVVVDIRWNGGGRLHEDIEVLLSGEKYLTQVIRGVESCDMPSRRWNKPSIMLMAEACYSNAHGTPWVYKHRGIGKLVGMPVPGTMTSVNWITMQDPSLVYGIPVVGYKTAEGTYLENSQLEPDVKVVNNPQTVTAGEDSQLRAAVETLLHDIDAKKKH